MVQKPSSYTMVGLVQLLLASGFVIWLVFFPAAGVDFAWPVKPVTSAMFLGASFAIRAFLGFHLWREKNWYRLRWITWGNYAFLGVILLATFWHVDKLNWSSNLLVAHIWILAYIVEPLLVVIIEPRDAASRASLPASLSEGPVFVGFKRILVLIYMIGFALAGLLMLNPAFVDTRWPWPLDPFDARILSAFFAGVSLWALSLYYRSDWAEIKMGIQAPLVYVAAIFGVWLASFSAFDPARKNIWTYGLLTGAFLALLVYYYVRQERARRNV